MAVLINRNPVGRLICLHSLVNYIYSEFGDASFNIKDLKFNPTNKHNIHEFCPLLILKSSWPIKVCPYLQNPISDAKCYLTQSTLYDTQKSKSASDAMNALDGINWVDRTAKGAVLTESGKRVAKTSFDTLVKTIQEDLLSYGPFIGFIWKLLQKSNSGIVKRNDIFIGFPKTEERFFDGNNYVTLSTGSQNDTNTRTRSILITWALTAGLIKPIEESIDTGKYILSNNWSLQKFQINFDDSLIKNRYVPKPLEYNWLTKDTRALRERNQQTQRNVTLQYEEKIKNRRLAIIYTLNEAYNANKKLSYEKLIESIKGQQQFVVSDEDFKQTMLIEKDIANIAGIPFKESAQILKPITHINKQILIRGVDESVINSLDKILANVLI